MTRRKSGRPINGFFLLDKPQGLSSNAALQKVKRLFDARKAGHCGSLDPLATGVLPICFGEATKFSGYLLESDKTYLTTATFGIKTDSGDAEGNIIDNQPVNITDTDIKGILSQFTGKIQQIPPMYSALKHKGQPLYKLAREGIEVERKAREVFIYQLELQDWTFPQATFRVYCSKGTYIRTLVEDIGEMLGCGAHVTMLRRINAGPFDISQSHTLETLEKQLSLKEGSSLDEHLLPEDSALQSWPAIYPDKLSSHQLQQGKTITVSDAPSSGLIRLYDNNRFIGIGRVETNGEIAPQRLISSNFQ